MSAVCGIFARTKAPESLPAALAALAHWGPRASTWQADGAAIGVRQASEPKLRNALHRDDDVVVAVDIRFDDRDALCDALGIDRGRRDTVTDAALIARAWRKWGDNCPDALYGDFAFVVYDIRRRRLFCARDHVGVRPFYFAALPGRFVFASCMEAILDVPGVPLDLDRNLVAAGLGGSLHIAPAGTSYSAVRQLPAGHALTVDVDRSSVTREWRYWRPERMARAAPATDAAYAEELLDHCQRAVRVRLPAATAGRQDTDTAVHLTGGIDSSAITVLANRELRRQGRPPPVAYCWQPPPDDGSLTPEHQRIEAIRVQEGVTMHYQAKPSAAELATWYRHNGTVPSGSDFDESARAARAGARCLLSGLGGDDCVSGHGYGFVPHLLLRGRWRTLASELRARHRPVLGAVVLDLVKALVPSYGKRYAKARRSQPPWRALLTGLAPNRRPGGTYFLASEFTGNVLSSSMPLMRGSRSTHLKFMADGHLALRMAGEYEGGMCHGVEWRYPLLDRRLLEFGLSLPDASYYRYPGRLVMRQAFDGLLPTEVCWTLDKTEPVRFANACDGLADAFPPALAAIEKRQTPPVRADYLDLPRVLATLRDPEAFRARPRPDGISSALGFLDF